MQLNKLAFALLAGVTLAHPGEEHHHDRAVELSKREFKQAARRGLSACSEKLNKRDGMLDRAVMRRAATVVKYRKQLAARDTDTGETGPYWVKGEYIRNNLREDQPGVPIVIEAQFVDVETCQPIQGLYWDVWNCNSTGVYSGLIATGNGNTDDLTNYNATFLRGVAKSNCDGVVQFESVFPGHYSGRTTHHHMVAHLNATVLPNNTLTGGTVAHVGQVFWDQDLIYDVEATYPYNTNDIAITTNADDRVFSTESSDNSDPVFEYVYLGDDLSDGLFGWVTIAVNTSATYDPNYSFVWTESGGIAQSGGTVSVDGGSGDGGAPSGGNGTSPSGSLSGAVPSGTAAPSA
ncbi:Intradiol ring-cleavage dioxygenase [Truncatella angustata]|uniref:Intradiol ring-cleavage dioxygenase n=1 Tax=Truncatella angustata TaxID=152316 RepID=A0A9P8ULT5_9PEZI|nr:Intradiol ring-cleavage dioxygenase [Truncatella angustata]KAH6654521.1 Intradiol ring-cleavage dioxygenase [Truncatella angustata]